MKSKVASSNCRSFFKRTWGVTEITLTLSARTKNDHHKLTISPSVAVNPPAIQYFSGIKLNWIQSTGIEKIDKRAEEMTEEVVRMLSSDEYPSLPVCSKRRARQFAKVHIPRLISNLDRSKKEQITKVLELP